MFATAAEDVRVWSSASLQQCFQFDVVKAPKVSSVSWSSDGMQLASVAREQDVILLTSFGTGQPRHARVHAGGPCICGQFSQLDSDYMGLGLYDGTVQLFKSGKAVNSYKVHKEATCVAFSKDDDFLASGASDGSMALFRLETKRAQILREPTGKAVMGLQWSPHNRFQLLSCSLDGQLSVWDASVRCVKSRHCLHPGQPTCALSLSPINESLVATVGLDGTLVLFDLATKSEQASVRAPECLESVAFLPDGQRVVVGASSGQVYLYDLRNTRQVPPIEVGKHAAPVTAITTMQRSQAQMAVLVRTDVEATNVIRTSKEMPIRFSLSPDVESRACAAQASSLNGLGLSQGDVGASCFPFNHGKAPVQPLLSPDDSINPTSSPGDVFTEEQYDGKNLMDASWTFSSDRAEPRRRFRLSDIMPVLSEPSSLSKSVGSARQQSPTVSPGGANGAAAAADASPEAPVGTSSTGMLQNHLSGRMDWASSNSATTTPEGADQSRSVRNRRSARASQPTIPEEAAQNSGIRYPPEVSDLFPPEDLVSRLEDFMTDRARHLDAHMRHMHIQLILMHNRFADDMQNMLQEIFDEVLALRAEIRELRGDL